MLIDTIYQTVQAKLNKEQLGYLPPINYNLFVNNGQIRIFNELFPSHKTNVRKMNWMLDGKDFADISERTRQLLEYYAFETSISPISAGNYNFPDDCEKVEDVFDGNIRIDKLHYSDFKDLQRNIYAAPNSCNPICTKVGATLKVLPTGIDPITMHYIRRPKTAKWTFNEVSGKPMFNPDANDFQDVDIPYSESDALTSLVFEDASIYLRDLNATQLANQEQQQQAQLENID